MASLRKRGDIYYIVFAKRENGRLEQKAYSLGTRRKRKAEALKVEFGEQYRLGEIDPFGDWTPKKAAERKRAGRTGGTVTEMIERFVKARSHVKKATRDEYEARLKGFAREVGRTMPVRLLEPRDIRNFCFKSSHSRATQRTYLRYCRMFFRWLDENDHLKEDISKEVKYPKKKQKVAQKAISEKELLEIFKSFRSEQRKRVRKDKKRGLHIWFRPMAALGFYAGLRRSEMVRLTWDKVDLEEEYLYVTDTKNGKERVVPMRKKLVPYLRAWHRLCGYPRSGLVLFKSDKPGRHTGRKFPLTGDNLTKVFKEYAEAAEMPDSVCLHGLRHSCATELLRLGMGIHEVADILGHSSIEVTRIYEHLNEKDLKRKMEQLGI